MKLALPSRFRGGFALIIVMLAIFVLATMAAMLAFSMKVETKLASTANNDQDMIWMARSGVELARWTLVQEASIPSEPYDSLNQIWAGGAGTAGESNSPVNGVPLTDYPIGNGSVSIKIIDLERYANINTATTPLLQQALTVMGVDADDMSVISDSIQDWVQPGDSPRIAGAKNDYYQSLDPPYNCKEAPIDDMSELLLVHGISEHPEIYWGGTASNVPPSPFQHHLGIGNSPDEPVDYPFGLKDVFTPFSTGQINVNTADANVLQLIPGVDTNSVASILQYRAGPDGDETGSDATPFQNVGQLQAAGISPVLAQQMGAYCTVRSSTFKVTVTARIGQNSRDFYAILFRTGGTVRIVDFYWDE
ncbi:MAG: general secretion pathway protein GspK [Limisphaerales bacterium]